MNIESNRVKVEDVGVEMVEAVEAEVGQSSTAWDCIGPAELVAAVINVFLRRVEDGLQERPSWMR